MTSQSLMGEVFFALCKSIDTPVALGCWLRWKYNQTDLAEKRVHPLQYHTIDTFLPDFVVTSYLKKYEALETNTDRGVVALSSFAGAERHCQTTNELYRDPQLRGISPRVHGILHAMQRKIAAVLGPLEIGEAMTLCKWGPGATASIPRRRAHLDTKISEAPMTVTSAALKYMRAYLEIDYHWFESISGVFPSGPYSVVDDLVFRVVPGDEITTVPKDATTDRTIGKAPTANSFLQQGAGRYIRKQLRRVSVDLDDQSVNATWAFLAKQLDLCTLDLKSASDTIAKEVVKHLLPFDWWSFLSDLRSPFFTVDGGTWTHAEKFSAMGTAFTFELESLIFWAAVQAATEIADPGGVVSVYGDDIVCTRRAYPLVLETLEALGFTINISKSHVSGEYYESCGKHYWGGVDVTPTYQKEELDPLGIPGLIRAHNRLYRGAHRFDSCQVGVALDKSASVLRRYVLSTLGVNALIPDWEQSDDGLLTSVWELIGDHGAKWCENHGICCTVLSGAKRRRFGRGLPLLAHVLRLNRARSSTLPVFEEEVSSISPQLLDETQAKLRFRSRWISIPPLVL